MIANLLMLIFASLKSDTSAAMEGRFYFFGNICLCTCTELKALVIRNATQLGCSAQHLLYTHKAT